MTRAAHAARSLPEFDLRWVQRAGLVLVWALALLLMALGLRDLLMSPDAASSLSVPDPTLGFPVTDAGAFASRFTTDYLTWESDRPGVRDNRMARYLASGLDDRAGWNGAGSQQADSPTVVRTEVTDAEHAVVTVAARVVSAERVWWVHLAVPVTATDDGFAVSALPALTPAPAEAEARTPTPREDQRLSREVAPTVGAWCRAYAAGDRVELGYLAAEGVRLPSLGGWRCVGVSKVIGVEGDEPVRTVLADVVLADDIGAAVQGTYAMKVTRDRGRWYLADVPSAYVGG